MPASNKLSFRKEERLCSRKLIDELFCGGVSRSMTAFPLRAIYLLIEEGTGGGKVQVLVSVPKKQLKLAVKRNRVKRQVREAYRRNKQILLDKLTPQKQLLIAFIWIDNQLHDSTNVQSKVVNLLNRIAERL